jgi:predicted NBD/HSP70 family sugar kinase
MTAIERPAPAQASGARPISSGPVTWTPKPAIELSSQRAVRRHNLGLVLRQVVERGPRSRATIALDTGLNKTTVSSLVSELMDLGLLVERGAEARSSAGRPGLVVDVAREGAVALGLEINVDYLGVQATDLGGGSRYKAMEAVDNRRRGVDDVLDRLAALANDALTEVRAQGLRPIGATVALPGLVDVTRGELLAAPNLHWNDVAVIDQLRERMDAGSLPLDADNEANLAALAELWEGVGVGLSDFMYASGQVGVGGGIVLGGELFRGFRGFGGEFGHMTVEADGLPCACGSRGCLEARAGLEPLLAAAGLDGDKIATTGSGKPVAELVKRASAGDETALAALEDSGGWLGVALGSVVNLLSPQTIVLGGYFAPLAPWLRPAIERELEARVLGGPAAVPPVLPSSLGPEAAMRGAAATQLRRVLVDPTLVAA